MSDLNKEAFESSMKAYSYILSFVKFIFYCFSVFFLIIGIVGLFVSPIFSIIWLVLAFFGFWKTGSIVQKLHKFTETRLKFEHYRK